MDNILNQLMKAGNSTYRPALSSDYLNQYNRLFGGQQSSSFGPYAGLVGSLLNLVPLGMDVFGDKQSPSNLSADGQELTKSQISKKRSETVQGVSAAMSIIMSILALV